MNSLAAWIHTPIAQALAWTLAHFLWEGALLAAVLMAALRLSHTSPAQRRYTLACLTLLAMPVAFAATLALMWALRPVMVTAPIHWTPVPLGSDPISIPAPRFSAAAMLDRLVWLVPVWFAGVAFFYTRSVAGWIAVRRLRRRGVCAPAPQWQRRLEALAARLRISRPVALLESCFTDTPVLIGYLRPVILLPLGCLTGLSAAQVECILLHELAHVARHDYVVNLLQSLVEGLLFYHPAMWWVSRTVRAERENCCDDRVVELMGNARAYAATLAALEQRRAVAPHAALAATGGNLMQRIRRLTMESRGPQTSVAPAFSAAMVLVIFAAARTALPAKLPAKLPNVRHAPAPVPLAAAAATPQGRAVEPATPYQKWLNEDVVYIITKEERSAFRKLTTDEERDEFIAEFWLRRGLAVKEEHYRRLAYANQHFASDVAGWKTDRGRTYITYGPPDEIDDHSTGGSYQRPAAEGGGTVTTYPFQQWRYRYIESVGNNIIVEFVDRLGNGDFRMTSDPAEKENTPIPYKKWINEDVAYIMSGEERAAFQKLSADQERDNFIAAFWKRRDPTPGTEKNEYREEHYRRIAFANQHFSTGIPGWKTDRGRIYIVYGSPDSEQTVNARTIAWTYRYVDGAGENVTLVFEDSNSTGEFHLTKDPMQDHAQVVGPVDVLAAETANQRAKCESLLRLMTTLNPRLQACNDKLRQLEQQVEAAQKPVH